MQFLALPLQLSGLGSKPTVFQLQAVIVFLKSFILSLQKCRLFLVGGHLPVHPCGVLRGR